MSDVRVGSAKCLMIGWVVPNVLDVKVKWEDVTFTTQCTLTRNVFPVWGSGRKAPLFPKLSTK